MPSHASLFVSLGNSPAVVPEAFLLPGVRFTSVHVLTTDRPEITLIARFFAQYAPDVTLTFTRVEGFVDFRSEHDHFHFEEVLYRWILAASTPPDERWMCLSGGFKTMSAALQKAAAVLGAAEVFHVLADLGGIDTGRTAGQPGTIDEILAAHRNGRLHWIRLGPESGWPQLSTTSAAAFPLETTREEDGVRWVRSPDDAFRAHLREIVDRSHRIAGAWDRIPDLPFPGLATWSRAQLDWLDQPFDPTADRAWLARLPKIELHCHLGGFATQGETLARVRSAATQLSALPPLENPDLPAGWPLPPKPLSLDRYMALGNDNGSRLLRDPGCLAAQCEALYSSLVADRVVYAEIRCSPNNYSNAEAGRSAHRVLADIRENFQQLMDHDRAAGRLPCHINLLVIATRREGGDRSNISRHLALAITAADEWRGDNDCRVVGVDLAGFEHRETRAALFATDFEPVHRVGLAVTIHAGENDDAEGIWQAVFKLNARRLGHALHLRQSPDLLRAVAERAIAVEMCPYANVQIAGYAPVNGREEYPLYKYLRAGVRVTVNTDNLGISAASLTDNLALAGRLNPRLTRGDLIRLQRHALDSAFTTPAARARLSRQLDSSLPFPPTQRWGSGAGLGLPEQRTPLAPTNSS